MLNVVAHIWTLSTQEVNKAGTRIGSQDGHRTKTLCQRQILWASKASKAQKLNKTSMCFLVVHAVERQGRGGIRGHWELTPGIIINYK